MDQYVIKGGNPLVGEVEIGGAKNAALAILAAAIMTDETVLIENLPDVRDINITLEYAAGRMNFSTSHFSKTFKKLMGINFVTYLNVVRVERAAYELRHTEKKITDIALNCGFNNIRTFNRVFKEITGCTPSEFLLLPDPDTYKRTYYNRRSSEKEFVKDDSLTLVKNFESENS